jgi:hypothetical protein
MDMLLSGMDSLLSPLPSHLHSSLTKLLISFNSKHLFIPNFADVECGYAIITEENKGLIESCYEARKENELAVLIQYIDRNKQAPPKATFLDIILYSREQIIKENIAMGSEVSTTYYSTVS